MEDFTARLNQALQQKQMTQSELCEKTGISRSTMSQYCSGSFRPRDGKLRRIAKALGVKEAWLMGYDSEEAQELSLENYPNLRPVRLKRFPLLGEIACGKPIFAQEERESFIMADADIHADFCLLARGDSMIGARIYDGDAVFIRSQPMVDNGEIAAVIIDDEATLKRVYYDRKHARLQLVAENPAYSPLVYVGEELEYVRILGKAVGFMSLL
ncbi:XRE family transcriptional regulator [Ruminococcus sp.]|uniref:LexA family protein n=1 Tax=Ruminococcus sp. TaxID=41978 RepID=UPI0025F54B94|nr:XRE family transcriptional regulator [Ruminococcus sp.]